MTAPLRIVYNPYPDVTTEHREWNAGSASETCPNNASPAFRNGFVAGQHNRARRERLANAQARHAQIDAGLCTH